VIVKSPIDDGSLEEVSQLAPENIPEEEERNIPEFRDKFLQQMCYCCFSCWSAGLCRTLQDSAGLCRSKV